MRSDEPGATIAATTTISPYEYWPAPRIPRDLAEYRRRARLGGQTGRCARRARWAASVTEGVVMPQLPQVRRITRLIASISAEDAAHPSRER